VPRASSFRTRAPWREAAVARFAWPLALARNVALFPVVLVHAFRVLASRMTG
jgi:hypothetical protein